MNYVPKREFVLLKLITIGETLEHLNKTGIVIPFLDEEKREVFRECIQSRYFRI